MNAKEKADKFLSLFDHNSKVLIIINADPDSIASAMAVKRLLWRKAKEIVIAYFNKISRPDNLAMIEYTESGIIPIDEIKKQNHNTFVIVDSQADHHEQFSKFNYDAIIDHHPLSDDNAKFVDIRPDFGACSTILTQYLKAKKIKPSSKLAAA
jgi:nanoRNase/pAp phosphatase (c-di-AMP/oligoRNAs hydrolase)